MVPFLWAVLSTRCQEGFGGFCDEDLCLLGSEQSSEHQQNRGCAGAVGEGLADECKAE